MIYVVKPPTHPIQATINLPASKSISNRVLIIRALSGFDFQIKNMSDCDDTNVMLSGLQLPDTIDVGGAGTSMRFLTAYLSQLDGQEHIITGSERMKQRPIKILVDALRTLGADIEYLGEIGYPPLKIRGKELACTDAIDMDGSVSSQYISAVLMIGPMLKTGLKLRLDGEVASRPYIDMTLALMQQFGAETSWSDDLSVIEVKPKPYSYKKDKFTVEPDWSAAAFWFEILAIRGHRHKDRVKLPGLILDSIQGDSVCRWCFDDQGSMISGLDNTVTAFHNVLASDYQYYNFTKCPDLAQSMIVTSCLVDLPFLYTGLESLHIKETDRIGALKTELAKLGYLLRGGEGEEGILMWQRGSCKKQKNPVIETYKDHRMAMAFAPACIKFGEIRIADPGVVSKSYPHFWDDLRTAGFTIEEVEE
ncbi:MAG: 3-phosphoshikimate 1-carboxyvinyltransferase [Bacteroidaceae bacterium]|nr:3-phosphoshikimate 1-carboxyvinyltransferase [Bacteroidaceae bacterium]